MFCSVRRRSNPASRRNWHILFCAQNSEFEASKGSPGEFHCLTPEVNAQLADLRTASIPIERGEQPLQ